MENMLMHLRFSCSAAACALFLLSSPPARAVEDPVLSGEMMSGAIDYLGVVTGTPFSDDDQAWLRQRWAGDFARTPHEVAAQLDAFLVRHQAHRRDADPIALAASRRELIDGIYCAAEQTGDPDVHRLRAIMAPAELILASDCAFGLVVTSFDIDGLVASHGLVATLAGLSFHDGDGRASVEAFVESGFDEAEPETKVLMAEGEMRHAMASRFWRRVDERTKAELTAELRLST